MKKNIFGILLILLIGCSHIQTQTLLNENSKKENIDTIVEYIKSPDTKLLLKVVDPTTSEILQRTVLSTENNTVHNYFLWDYTHHYISVCRYEFSNVLYVETKDYKVNLSGDNSKSLVTWNIIDKDFDGIVDEWIRSFELVTEYGMFIFPKYPKDFINENWVIPSYKIAQERFDKEIEHWINIKGNEQWEIKIQPKIKRKNI